MTIPFELRIIKMFWIYDVHENIKLLSHFECQHSFNCLGASVFHRLSGRSSFDIKTENLLTTTLFIGQPVSLPGLLIS